MNIDDIWIGDEVMVNLAESEVGFKAKETQVYLRLNLLMERYWKSMQKRLL